MKLSTHDVEVLTASEQAGAKGMDTGSNSGSTVGSWAGLWRVGVPLRTQQNFVGQICHHFGEGVPRGWVQGSIKRKLEGNVDNASQGNTGLPCCS
jgi:hypothetical protein